MDSPSALIIEDDRDIAALFQNAMDLSGFRTEVVFHGRSAVERLANSQPDIVLLDLNLAGVPGNKILELIRKDERLNHTKVIVVTGYAHVADSLSVQPDLVLLKPVSIEQLTSLARRMILSNQSQKEIPLQQKPFDGLSGD